jgi:hypothetical protein
MSGRVIGDASITVPLDGTALDAYGIAKDARLSALVKAALEALAHATRAAHAL